MSNDDRNTPEEVLEPVRRFFGLIELDPCSNEWSTVGARISYTIDDDGLSRPWNEANGFVNPPWSNCAPFCFKGICDHIDYGIELLYWLPCYPETGYSRALYRYASRVCFWHRRVSHPLHGDPASSGSMWPTQLVYLGGRAEEFDEVFGDYGTTMMPIATRR